MLLSLNASAIYLGVGLSGVVGGAALEHLSPRWLPEVSAVLMAVCLVFALAGLRDRRTAGVVGQAVPADPSR